MEKVKKLFGYSPKRGDISLNGNNPVRVHPKIMKNKTIVMRDGCKNDAQKNKMENEVEPSVSSLRLLGIRRFIQLYII